MDIEFSYCLLKGCYETRWNFLVCTLRVHFCSCGVFAINPGGFDDEVKPMVGTVDFAADGIGNIALELQRTGIIIELIGSLGMLIPEEKNGGFIIRDCLQVKKIIGREIKHGSKIFSVTDDYVKSERKSP